MIAIGGDLLPGWGWVVAGVVAAVVVMALVVVALAMFLSVVTRIWERVSR